MSEKEKQELLSALVAEGEKQESAFDTQTCLPSEKLPPDIGKEKIVSPLPGRTPVTETVLPELLLPPFMIPGFWRR